MRTLIVDNYDSYTFNLFQLIAEVNGQEPLVVGTGKPASASSRACRSTTSSSHRDRARRQGLLTLVLETSARRSLCLGSASAIN